MAAAQFIIAKYIPDLARMEPRNVGVVVWDNGRTASRFYGDEIDGQLTPWPAFVARKNRGVYKRWVQFWKDEISKESIRGRRGRKVSRDNEEFMDRILLHSKENFVLTRGGKLPSKPDVLDVDDLAEQLFAQFVAELSEQSATEARNLSSGWREAAHRAGIFESVEQRSSLQFKIGSVSRHFQVDYKFGKKLPQYCQRALLTKPESTNSASLMMMAIDHSKALPREQYAAIVHVTESEVKDPTISEGLAMLGQFTQIINVAKIDEAAERLLEMEQRSIAI